MVGLEELRSTLCEPQGVSRHQLALLQPLQVAVEGSPAQVCQSLQAAFPRLPTSIAFLPLERQENVDRDLDFRSAAVRPDPPSMAHLFSAL